MLFPLSRFCDKIFHMLTTDQQNEVFRMADDSYPFSRIAEETGLPLHAIQDFLLVETRIRSDYKTTNNVSTICSHYGISQSRFYQLLTHYSIPLRRNSGTIGKPTYSMDYSQPDRDEVASDRKARLDRAVEMYIAGEKIWAIKQSTGISQPLLHSELAMRGVPKRRDQTLPPGHLTPEQVVEARAMRAQGQSFGTIARHFNTTPYIVTVDLASTPQ